MKIGDLVRYGNGKDYGLGIVVRFPHFDTVTVLWGNGVTSNHAARYIIPVKEAV